MNLGTVETAADRRVLASVGLVVIASFIVRVATLSQPLVEAHSFRQTQTAFTAVIYHREGINLLQSPVPVFGPPWVVPFEFPLFQAIASLVIDAGTSTEIALRGTSLAFFVVSTWILWHIVRLEVDARTASIVAVAFVVAPLGLLWSRTSTIETLAVAGALGAVLEALRFDRTGSRAHLGAAIALASLAALLKITTAAIWLAPAIFLLRRSRVATAAILVASAAAGLVWTAYTDAIKAASPATDFLTSASLREWNFGSIAQRLDPATWLICLGWIAGIGFLVFLAPMVVRGSRIGGWALATFFLGPLVFTNLYVVHDYYWMAVAPAGAILIGLVVGTMLRTDSQKGRRTGLMAVVVVFGLSFIAYPRWISMLLPVDPDGVLPQAAQIRAATSPDHLIAIDQGSWSPAVLFYAGRRGYMEYPGIPPAPTGYVRFRCPEPGHAGLCVQSDLP